MSGAPVSLALTNTVPAASSLPPSLPLSLLSQPNLPNIGAPPTGNSTISTTRILHLSAFSPELKTRDIQSIFAEWEDERGGFKIKWVDDTTAMIVFNEATTAKKAFLTLLANPHPLLQLPTPLSPNGAKLRAHSGPDVTHILTSVQNRPRSRSNAGAHSRKSSMNVPPLPSGPRSADPSNAGGANGVFSHRRGSSGAAARQGSMGLKTQASASQLATALEGVEESAISKTPPKAESPTEGESFVSATSNPVGSPPKIGDAGKRHLNAALGIRGVQAGAGQAAEEAIREEA